MVVQAMGFSPGSGSECTQVPPTFSICLLQCVQVATFIHSFVILLSPGEQCTEC